MLTGRLEVYSVLVLLTRIFWRADAWGYARFLLLNAITRER